MVVTMKHSGPWARTPWVLQPIFKGDELMHEMHFILLRLGTIDDPWSAHNDPFNTWLDRIWSVTGVLRSHTPFIQEITADQRAMTSGETTFRHFRQ